MENLKPALFYSPKYIVDYGAHAFATEKFKLTAEALKPHVNVVEPRPATRDEILLAHDPIWTDKVLTASLTAGDCARLELPFSPEISLAHQLSAGGTIMAAENALNSGVGLHCGGGSHHAFRGHGEGYCALNDLAIATLVLLKKSKDLRVAIVDLDVHQGNGTAAILEDVPNTFTFSMHQYDIYPMPKKRSNLDIDLLPGTNDAEYHDKLNHSLKKVIDFKPDLILYQAGVDVWQKDQLGGLNLTERGILDRDTSVWENCQRYRIPVVVTLGGGYGPTPLETARLHSRTLMLFGAIPVKI